PRGNAFDEVGRFVDRWSIGAIEGNFDCFLLQSSLVKNVLEARTFPPCAAHGAVTPFNPDNVRLRKTASVSGALVDRDYFDRRHLLQVVEADLDRTVDAIASHGDLVGLDVHSRDVRQMVANKELIVRRDCRPEGLQW